MNTDNINELLNTRVTEYGKYGDFLDKAQFAQDIKELYRARASWKDMDADQQEALDMIAHKIARLVCGNPFHLDSWQDIAGYATLVVNRLK